MLPRSHYLKQFYRDIHLPCELEQSGLTPAQARLIKKHGILIRALLENQVSDPNGEDQHLLKVIERGCNPRTPLEQAWLKYLELIDREDQQQHLSSALRQTG